MAKIYIEKWKQLQQSSMLLYTCLLDLDSNIQICKHNLAQVIIIGPEYWVTKCKNRDVYLELQPNPQAFLYLITNIFIPLTHH